VPADRVDPSWELDVEVVSRDDAHDFRGPAVQGRRGERFLSLTWGDVADDGSFEMFRRAKLMLDRIDPTVLDAAVAAGVPRFIPSDFAIDFYRMPDGYNRNLDWRREFSQRLESRPIAATSILNGMFMELLAGQAPFILTRFHRVVYWEHPDQPMDFTTIHDTAAYTAAAALDPATPRFLHIAGDVASARDLAAIATDVHGSRFKLFRAGKLSRLEKLIGFVKRVAPGRDEVYPPWQGMQYMHNMYDGRAKLEPLDNARYSGLAWTSIRELLAEAAVSV
jgi:hypothetical protein